MAANDNVYHQEALKKLCRICGHKLKKPSKETKIFHKIIKECFGHDIVGEDQSIFPTLFCHNCHTKMQNIKKNRKCDLHLTKWYAHSLNCKTCLTYQNVQRGGKKSAKSWRPGRPKSAENFSLNDAMQLDPSKPIPDVVRKIVGHLVNMEAKQTTGNIISLPSAGSSPTGVICF